MILSFQELSLLKVEVLWFMQVSDRLNIKLLLKYPVKLVGTAVLNYIIYYLTKQVTK